MLTGLLLGLAAAQELPTPWRNDPLFQRLAAALDAVSAIDNHTHLLQAGKFDPSLAAATPVLLRSTHPWFLSTVKARFGITVEPGDWAPAIEAIASARDAMVKRLERARLLDESPRLHPYRDRPRQREQPAGNR